MNMIKMTVTGMSYGHWHRRILKKRHTYFAELVRGLSEKMIRMQRLKVNY